MSDWVFDHPFIMFLLIIALMTGGFYWLAGATDKQNKKDCAQLMTVAVTQHDTLEVKIACMRMDHPDVRYVPSSTIIYTH